MLLLINDGQDLRQMSFHFLLEKNMETLVQPLVCIGIHCGADRLMEYGVTGHPDYEGRGAKAGLYAQFIMEELLPFLHSFFGIKRFKEKAFAGFSLGGLSALDLVWNYPEEFKIAGVFSGALWWRSKSYENGYKDDTDRIMHEQIKKGKFRPGLKFFFQCGLLDENADRNNNGIIDSVEDTRDLIVELIKKGYREKAIQYLEMADGKHEVATWAKAFPYFLQWGWGGKD